MERNFRARLALLLALLASPALAVGTNENAPVWTAIPPTSYFKYDQWTQWEFPSFSASYPQTYWLSNLTPYTNGGVDRTTCMYQDQTDPAHPIYWFDGNTRKNGTFPHLSTPFEYHEAWTGNSIKGFTFKGAFRGGYSAPAAGTNSVQTVFFTDKFCTDGGAEFGFARRLDLGDVDAWGVPRGSLFFYYSDFTNCEGNVCRVDAAGTSDMSPRPDISALKVIRNLQSRTPGNDVFFYSAYLINNATSFRVQVVEPDTVNLATCIPPGEWWSRACTFDVPIALSNPRSFPNTGGLTASGFDHGWMATVIAKGGGSPVLSSGTSLYVEGVWVGK